MRDDRTTVAELKAAVASFVAERAWERYHTPKNLAMSIAIEAAELMEHFQWTTLEEAGAAAATHREAVEDELADVVAYCASLANALGTDLAAALARKIEKNRLKYPAADFRGAWRRPEGGGAGR